MSKQQKSNVVVGVGITVAAAAAAAGALFLYGTKAGKQQKKKIKGWALKAKGEILEKIEGLKEVNEEAYNKIVTAVSDRYAKLKNIDPEELATLVKEVQGHWKNIKKQLAGPAKKKPAKKAASKSTDNK